MEYLQLSDKIFFYLFLICFKCLFFQGSYATTLSDIEIKTLPQKPIVVIIPSYKNIDWYTKNLQTILSQQYSNYRIIYLNDCSPDGMELAIEQFLLKKNIDLRVINFDDSFSEDIVEVTEKFVEIVNQESHFFTLINNVNRCGALENIYRAVKSCNDDEIIVTIDGDDWLYKKQVLIELNAIYSLENVWLTHGTLIHYPNLQYGWSEPIPQSIIEANAFRDYKCPSHLRTFYAWLFKKIKLEDLLYKGKFFAMTWDMAMMYPMIEMCGDRHAFIPKANYYYNIANQINDNKVNPELQNELDNYIRNMPRYEKL